MTSSEADKVSDTRYKEGNTGYISITYRPHDAKLCHIDKFEDVLKGCRKVQNYIISAEVGGTVSDASRVPTHYQCVAQAEQTTQNFRTSLQTRIAKYIGEEGDWRHALVTRTLRTGDVEYTIGYTRKEGLEYKTNWDKQFVERCEVVYKTVKAASPEKEDNPYNNSKEKNGPEKWSREIIVMNFIDWCERLRIQGFVRKVWDHYLSEVCVHIRFTDYARIPKHELEEYVNFVLISRFKSSSVRLTYSPEREISDPLGHYKGLDDATLAKVEPVLLDVAKQKKLIQPSLEYIKYLEAAKKYAEDHPMSDISDQEYCCYVNEVLSDPNRSLDDLKKEEMPYQMACDGTYHNLACRYLKLKDLAEMSGTDCGSLPVPVPFTNAVIPQSQNESKVVDVEKQRMDFLRSLPDGIKFPQKEIPPSVCIPIKPNPEPLPGLSKIEKHVTFNEEKEIPPTASSADNLFTPPSPTTRARIERARKSAIRRRPI